MKNHGGIGNSTKYDAFRVNINQAMNLKIWFKIHTNVSNFETAYPNEWFSNCYYYFFFLIA